MNLSYILFLVLLFLVFYFYGPPWVAWGIGILILLIVTAKLFSGTAKIGKGIGKEFTREMETDMMKSNGKPPSKEYLTEISREAGRKTGEFLQPEEYTYKSKGYVGKFGQGAKNFWNGLMKIFRK